VCPGRGHGRVVVPEPHHRLAVQHQLVVGIEVRQGVEVAVGDGVHENLEREFRMAPPPGPMGDDGGEVASGAIAPDHEWDRRPARTSMRSPVHCSAAQASSTAVGNRYSGALR